ncbi:UDP-GlcNAc:betaGal beta-1,3-N-acetylglucosaminyltransferase 7-like [Gastrophryne carolinensis]
MEIAKEENQEHGDVLQWDLMEGHHNLSLKERCFLEWLHWISSHVHYIFKGDDDDDVFVNPEMVVRYIAEHGTSNTVHGYHQHRPFAMHFSKYQISKTLYLQERYPGFVSGGSFLFPGAAIKSLYEASQLLPVFPLDDVYFGFLALAANLNFRNNPRFYLTRLDYDACRYKQAVMVHNINFENLTEI